jgi:hypothetical protein
MKKLILLGIMAWTVSGSASAGTLFEKNVPFIGLDYKWTRAKLKTDWNNLFAESFPGISLYGYMKFTDYVGFEIGYDMTARKSKNRGVQAGEMVGGLTVPANVSGYDSSLRFAGPYADLVAFLPMDANLELFFSIGLGRVKPTINVKSLTSSTTPFDAAMTSLRGQHQKISRVGIGGNWAITESVGMRVKILYEQFTRILVKDEVPAGVPPATVLHPWMKGYSLALGFFVKY